MTRDIKPQPVVPYAQPQTNLFQANNSLDRVMTARLARVVGTSLWIFGAIFVLLECVGVAMINSQFDDAAKAVGVIFIVSILPGLMIAMCATPIRDGGRGAQIVCLLATLWALLMALLGALGFGWALLHSQSPQYALAGVVGGAVVALGAGKLLFHNVRLLIYNGTRGGNATGIVHFTDLLSRKTLNESSNSKNVNFFLIAARGMEALLIFVITVYAISQLYQFLAISGRTSAKPVTRTFPLFTGDLHDNAFGLNATERATVTGTISALMPEITDDHRHALDSFLRERGKLLFLYPNTPASSANVKQSIGEVFHPSKVDWGEALAFLRFNSGFQIEFGKMGTTPLRAIARSSRTFGANGAFAFIQPDLPHWSLPEVESTLRRIEADAGVRLTVPQADAIQKELGRLALPYVQGFTTPPVKNPVGRAVVYKDGQLTIPFATTPLTVSPDGSIDHRSAEAIAAAAANRAAVIWDHRHVSVGFFAAALLLVAAVWNTWAAIATARAASSINPKKFARIHFIAACVTAVAIILFLIDLTSDDGYTYRQPYSISSAGSIGVMAGAWLVITGVIVPRKFSSATAVTLHSASTSIGSSS